MHAGTISFASVVSNVSSTCLLSCAMPMLKRIACFAGLKSSGLLGAASARAGFSATDGSSGTWVLERKRPPSRD